MADDSPESRNVAGEHDSPQTPWYAVLKSRRSFWITLGLALVMLGLVLRIARRDDAAHVRYVPVTRKIATGRVLVKALGYAQYPFQITPDMRDAQVTGNFTAYGGPTNTVSAVIMEEANYANWIAGQKADAFYSSDGQKNTDQFIVRLGPGKYMFAISNRLSKASQRYVYLDVDLIYYRAETAP